jgi:hypothetical protein
MKQELDKLRDEYEQMKKDAGFVELVREDHINPRVINALSTKKSKQLGKFNAAKYIIDQISSPNPIPIRDEFERMINKEYEKAWKMGFTRRDRETVLGRVFSKLLEQLKILKAISSGIERDQKNLKWKELDELVIRLWPKN